MPSNDENGPKNGPTLRMANPLMAKASQTPEWVKRIRQLVKATHGKGWVIREHRGGRTQISRTLPGGGGQTERVTVGIKWQASSAPALLAFIERLATHTEKGESIARAAELIHLEDEGPTAASVREGKLNWSDVVERFHHHKVSSGTISERTWRLRYRLHMNEVLQLLSEPKPPLVHGSLQLQRVRLQVLG